jgi:hypothetical protein
MNAAYAKALAASKLPEKDLAKARDAAEKDLALRQRVSAKVAALCG